MVAAIVNNGFLIRSAMLTSDILNTRIKVHVRDYIPVFSVIFVILISEYGGSHFLVVKKSHADTIIEYEKCH